MVGKVGKDLTEEEAYTAAQLCGLNMIATLKSASLARLQWRSRTLAHQRRALPLHPLIVFDTILILSPPSHPRPRRVLHAAELGDLDRVKRIVKVVGFVNCVDEFAGQPGVVNGCSDLMADVFGERGVHARSAVGTNALPLNIPVEIEAVVEIEE